MKNLCKYASQTKHICGPATPQQAPSPQEQAIVVPRWVHGWCWRGVDELPGSLRGLEGNSLRRLPPAGVLRPQWALGDTLAS